MAEPSDRPERDVTQLLQDVRHGRPQAESSLIDAVYAELHRLAAARLRGERAETTGPTALVHEAWLRLGLSSAAFDDRRHFFGAAGRVMRQVLVDRHRLRSGRKRAHHRAGDDALDAVAETVALPPIDLLVLDEALDELEALDARMAQIVQLRFFVGFSVEEVAQALEVSERTVKREWNVARAWLGQRLGPDLGG
jgi:RNA polymerase sigma factor (TIGR02999 family)